MYNGLRNILSIFLLYLARRLQFLEKKKKKGGKNRLAVDGLISFRSNSFYLIFLATRCLPLTMKNWNG